MKIIPIFFLCLLCFCGIVSAGQNMNNSINVSSSYYSFSGLDVNSTPFKDWLPAMMNKSANGSYTGDFPIYGLVKGGLLTPWQTAFSVNGFTDGANLVIVIITFITLFMLYQKVGTVPLGIMSIVAVILVGSIFEATYLTVVMGVIAVTITVSIMMLFLDRD